MIADNITEKQIQFYKIAKKNNISMSLCTDREIEVNESSFDKFNEFAKEIIKISPHTQVIRLNRNQSECIRGYSIIGDKALYLIDDDYYNRLISNTDELGFEEGIQIMKEKQLTLF